MVGQNIGKYRVVDRIGRGGMGTVYRATDETLHREVAIKVLNAELNDPVVARRFRAEAVTVARLNHPGIATIFELFQHEGQWLMVMEFVRGETFESLVLRKGPLPVEEAVGITMQALNALAHAHSLGVVHRDLKPANIMINEAGVVKVMDFGIARVSGTEHLTSVGFLMGTPAYMAPEQVTGGEIDARADLYSMACVLYHMLTGKLPFKGDTPFALAQSRIKDAPIPVRELRQDLPGWLGQVMDLALARTPEQRIQSAPLFHEALRRGLANLPLDTPAPGTTPPELIATVPGTLPTITPAGFPSSGSKFPMPVTTPASGSRATDLPPLDPTPLPFHGVSGAFAAPSPSQIVQMPLPSAATAPPSATPTSTPMKGIALTDRRADPAYDSAAVTMVSMPTPLMTPAAPQAPVETAPASSPTSGPSAPPTAARPGTPAVPATAGRGGLLVAAAAVVLLGGGGVFMWMKSRAVPPPAPAPGVVAPAPAVEVPAPPAEAATPPAAAPPPATPSAAPATPTTAPGVAIDPSGRGAAAPGTLPARGRGRAAAAPVRPNDPIVAYGELRAMVVSGKKAEEQDVVLSFVAGQISLVAKKGGGSLGTMAYPELKKAIYIRAKNPRWDAAFASPPADVDMPGGLFRSTRHWLALQSATAYFILRLNDADYRAVMATVTERTGMSIEQTPAGGL